MLSPQLEAQEPFNALIKQLLDATSLKNRREILEHIEKQIKENTNSTEALTQLCLNTFSKDNLTKKDNCISLLQVLSHLMTHSTKLETNTHHTIITTCVPLLSHENEDIRSQAFHTLEKWLPLTKNQPAIQHALLEACRKITTTQYKTTEHLNEVYKAVFKTLTLLPTYVVLPSSEAKQDDLFILFNTTFISLCELGVKHNKDDIATYAGEALVELVSAFKLTDLKDESRTVCQKYLEICKIMADREKQQNNTIKDTLQSQQRIITSAIAPSIKGTVKVDGFISLWQNAIAKEGYLSGLQGYLRILPQAIAEEDIKKHPTLQKSLQERLKNNIGAKRDKSNAPYLKDYMPLLSPDSVKVITTDVLFSRITIEQKSEDVFEIIKAWIAMWPAETQSYILSYFTNALFPVLPNFTTDAINSFCSLFSRIAPVLQKESSAWFLGQLFFLSTSTTNLSNNSKKEFLRQLLIAYLFQVVKLDDLDTPEPEIEQPDDLKLTIPKDSEQKKPSLKITKIEDLKDFDPKKNSLIDFFKHSQLGYSRLNKVLNQLPTDVCKHFVKYFQVNDLAFFISNYADCLFAQISGFSFAYENSEEKTPEQTLIPQDSQKKEMALSKEQEKPNPTKEQQDALQALEPYRQKLTSFVGLYGAETKSNPKLELAVLACRIFYLIFDEKATENANVCLKTLLELLEKDSKSFESFGKTLSLRQLFTPLLDQLLTVEVLIDAEKRNSLLTIIYSATDDRKPFRWHCLYAYNNTILTLLDPNNFKNTFDFKKACTIFSENLSLLEMSFFAPKEIKQEIAQIKSSMTIMSKSSTNEEIDITNNWPIELQAFVEKCLSHKTKRLTKQESELQQKDKKLSEHESSLKNRENTLKQDQDELKRQQEELAKQQKQLKEDLEKQQKQFTEKNSQLQKQQEDLTIQIDFFTAEEKNFRIFKQQFFDNSHLEASHQEDLNELLLLPFATHHAYLKQSYSEDLDLLIDCSKDNFNQLSLLGKKIVFLNEIKSELNKLNNKNLSPAQHTKKIIAILDGYLLDNNKAIILLTDHAENKKGFGSFFSGKKPTFISSHEILRDICEKLKTLVKTEEEEERKTSISFNPRTVLNKV